MIVRCVRASLRVRPNVICCGGPKGVAEIFFGTTDKFLAAHRFYEKRDFKELQKAGLPKAFPVMAVDSKFYVLRVS